MAIFRKQIKIENYVDNFDEIFNLGNTEFLKKVEIEFAGTLTAAGGSSDGSLVQDGLLKTILRKITMIANGSDPFVNTDGVGEYYRRAVMSGSPGVLVSTMPTGAGSTSQRVHVVLDMDQLQSAARFAGRVPAGRLSSLELRIEGGAVETNMVTGGDRTESMTGTYTVTAVFDSNPAGYKGGARRIGKKRYAVTAANDKAVIALPIGQYIADMLFVVVDNSVRNNALLTDFNIRLGERDERNKDTFLNQQSENVEKFGLELSSGAPPYTGVALVHFDEDGDMMPSKILNTLKMKVEGAQLEMTIGSPTGTAYVDVYTYGVDPKGVGR